MDTQRVELKTPPAGRSPPTWSAAARPAWERQLLARIKWAAGSVTIKEIGDRTGVHPETVRRYLANGRPTAYFVAAFCRTMGMPLEWLLYGPDGKTDRPEVPDIPIQGKGGKAGGKPSGSPLR